MLNAVTEVRKGTLLEHVGRETLNPSWDWKLVGGVEGTWRNLLRGIDFQGETRRMVLYPGGRGWGAEWEKELGSRGNIVCKDKRGRIPPDQA